MNIIEQMEKKISCTEQAKVLIDKLNSCKFKIEDFEECKHKDSDIRNHLGIFTVNYEDWTNGVIIVKNSLFIICKQEVTSTNLLIEIMPDNIVSALESEQGYLVHSRISNVVDALVDKYACKCSGAVEDEDENF